MMSNMEVIRELYNRCKDMDIEETLELELVSHHSLSKI